MNRSASSGRFSRRGYHHGNLKEALKAAAKQLILEKGPQGFSLVEAARYAKVSPAAPYRHYKDREALLRDIAETGFQRFSESLQQAWQQGAPDPLTALKRVAHAYIAFAFQEKAYYQTMFGARLRQAGETEKATNAGETAFQNLLSMVQALKDEADNRLDIDVEEVALHIWSFSHGIATLFSQDSDTRSYDPAELLENGVSIYLQGLVRNEAIQRSES